MFHHDFTLLLYSPLPVPSSPLAKLKCDGGQSLKIDVFVVQRWRLHAFVVTSMQVFQITGTPHLARDEIMRPFSPPRRATSVTLGNYE